MLPPVFADLEARVNAACARYLANAVASYNGGPEFGVLFERGVSDAPFGEVVDAATHQASYQASHTPGISAGHELLIDGTAYTVSGPVQPDSSGWLDLTLYPTAH